MTDKPTPTDAELKAMWQLHAADIGGIFCYARAVLQRWGQPSGAGEAAEHYRNAIASACEGWTMPDGLRKHLETALWSLPTQAQAGEAPLDEARRLFGAGWKAAALFCDREDVVADGIIGFGACPQFEAAFSAAQPVAREQLPKFLALKFYARRDKKATVTLLFPGHEAADAWVRGIKGGQHG